MKLNTSFLCIPLILFLIIIFDMCMTFPKTKMTQQQIESLQQVYRESCGFTFVNMGLSYSDYLEYMPSFKQSYDCKSQNFAIDYKIGEYTAEEEKIFKSNNYCLRLYYQGRINGYGFIG